MRRDVFNGSEFTIDEELAGEITLHDIAPIDDPPPVDIQGEPWGWKKPGPRPLGWRQDGNYDGTR